MERGALPAGGGAAAVMSGIRHFETSKLGYPVSTSGIDLGDGDVAPRNRRCALTHVLGNHGVRNTLAVDLLATSDPDLLRRVRRLPRHLPVYVMDSIIEGHDRTEDGIGRAPVASGPADPQS